MKRKILAILLVFSLLLPSQLGTAFAATTSGDCGKNATWNFNENTGVLTISGSGQMKDYPYSTLAPWSNYRYCSELITSIVINPGITSIGDYAFYKCEKVTNVIIPDTIESIGSYAFKGCSSLTSIAIPDSVTSIGSFAFEECSCLTNVNLPNNLTSLPRSIFEDCNNLANIIIPEGVTDIGDYAFAGCESLTEVIIPDGVTSIGGGAFEECYNLTSISIPNSVVEIEWYAFSSCNKLEQITIPYGVTKIASNTFFPSGLKSIVLPITVTSIGVDAFSGCGKLADIYYGGSEQEWKSIEIDEAYVGNQPLKKATIHYNSSGPNDALDTDTDVDIETSDYDLQKELQEKFIQEHIDYLKTSYSSDFVAMSSTPGLGFMLNDLKDDSSYDLYKSMNVIIANTDFMASFFNPFTYLDILGGKEEDSYGYVAFQELLDLGSSEYSVILYQLMASDTIYNGILDNFAKNYAKNTVEVASDIAGNALNLAKEGTQQDIDNISNYLGKQLEIMRTNRTSSIEYVTAYVNYNEFLDDHYDLRKVKDYLKETDTFADNAFSFAGAVIDEINSVREAYQYICWAKSYVETSESFKDILSQVAIRADDRAAELERIVPYNDKSDQYKDRIDPYSEYNMCRGLASSINSFIENMEKYSADSHKAFVHDVLESTEHNIKEFVGDAAGEELGKAAFPALAVVNSAMKAGKLLTDLFSNIDNEYKMALTVESLELFTGFLKEVSGGIVLTNVPGFPFISAPGTPSQFERAVMLDETVKMYKSAMLIACDYAMNYEESKLSYSFKKAHDVPDMWYSTGFTTSWQKQVSESSIAIDLLYLQQMQISDIHCHEDGLSYNNATKQIEWTGPIKVVDICCPIDVTVLDPSGKQLAYLSNGSVNVASGYESYFFIKPTDDQYNDYIKVVILPADSDYQVLLDGTDSGTMSIFSSEYDGKDLTDGKTFANYPITSDTTGYLDFDNEDSQNFLVLEGDTSTSETEPDIDTDTDTDTDTETNNECPSKKYIDVDQTLWYHEGIDYAITNGLMDGISKNAFAPNSNTTRAMMVTLLYRLEGEPYATSYSRFNDVTSNQWYAKAVSWATDYGIVNGYNSYTFGPDDEITREQMATILYRYAQYKDYDISNSLSLSNFIDDNHISPWASSSMHWAVAEKLIQGITSQVLSPEGYSTRAQIATILMRFCDKYRI